MSKLVYIQLRKSALEFMQAKYLLELLVKQGLIQLVEDKNHLIVGRYSTNKGKLRKILND